MNYSTRPVRMYSNTKETTAILNAVTTFGCIAINQIPYFMPANNIKRDNYPDSIIGYLLSSNQISKDGDCLCSLRVKHKQQEIIDSIWVMIEIKEKLSSTAVNYDEFLEECFVGSKPETLGFILNSSKVIRLIPVNSTADVTQVFFAQEKYYATGHKATYEDDSDLIYYLIVKDKLLLQDIANLNLTFPYKLAFMEEYEAERPTIKLLQPPKKK